MKNCVSLAVLFMACSGAALAAAPVRPPLTGVSHISLYAADAAKTDAFYTHDLDAMKGPDSENAAGVRYYFAPTQFVEILPLPAVHTINRMDHIAFTTADAEAMREYLASKHIKVPSRVKKGSDGSRWFDVTDPEGIKVQFLQAPPNPPQVPVNPLSNHIIHVGFIIHDKALEDTFYRDVLGFRPYWFGGAKEDKPTWISQQLPDSTDWIEYMVVGKPDGRGIPADMSQATAGILNHFSLGIVNSRDAYTLLWNGGRLEGQSDSNVPKIGRDAKWQLNLIDPDGTRAELMEFHAIGKPCCSPFTADDPKQ